MQGTKRLTQVCTKVEHKTHQLQTVIRKLEYGNLQCKSQIIYSEY